MIRFLQKPGPLKKFILGGILTVVCVMMVITLVPGGLFGDYLGGGLTTQGVLARVGDQEVGVTQVAQQARLMGKQQFKGNVPEQLMPYLMQRAAQSMITEKAMVYEADKMGLSVSDDELRDYLARGTDRPGAVSRAATSLGSRLTSSSSATSSRWACRSSRRK